MGVPGNANALLLASAAGGGAYQITRSLRFNAGDSAYLNRTPASAGNRKTFTWSGWYKAVTVGTAFLYGGGTSNSNDFLIAIQNDVFRVYSYPGSYTFQLQSTAVFRDPSAWYHLVVAIDTTQSTSSERVKLYVNGVLLTAFNTANYPAQNTDLLFNSTVAHYFGYSPAYNYSSFYLAETYFIDGQALDPSSFTTTDLTTGQLIPKAYTGSYGTNGAQLKFADNSSNTATTLGKDTSGNGNNWTPNNLSVTAGAGNDSLVDVPTNYGTDTGVGGEVRGNYCTWNSTWSNPTLTNGNLDYTTTTGSTSAIGTIGVSSGKWYFEITPSTSLSVIGVAPPSTFNTEIGSTATSYGYLSNGNKFNNGSSTAYGSTYTSNDVIGVALDLDNGKIWFSKNGTWQASGNPAAGTNAAFTGISGTFAPTVSRYTSTEQSGSLNCGQRPFAYTAPSGFKALNTANLPAPLVTKSNTVMDVVTWTGNGVNGRAITGLNFSPDFVWIKNRTNPSENSLFDTVRGAAKTLYSNQTAAELASSAFGQVNSFDAAGFTLTNGSDPTYPNLATNFNGSGIVGWCWDAGTTTVSNTQGSITSSVRANATAGFSVVTYTGTGATSGATVGHGLNVAPSLIISKGRNENYRWVVQHRSLGANTFLELNTTNATTSTTAIGAGSLPLPTSTVFSVCDLFGLGSNGGNYVAYVFSPVSGYSSFGSYTGNGSADGPFVYTGFRPRWIMLKRTDSTSSWAILDATRLGYNVRNDSLYANLFDAEANFGLIDILSNGFKLRATFPSENGGTHIYAAFAEHPFNFSRAR
jgi:hypothetical protein